MLRHLASTSFVVKSKTLKLLLIGAFTFFTVTSTVDAPSGSGSQPTIGFAEPLIIATAETEIDRQLFHSRTFIPNRLLIPAIKVDAVIQPVGKDEAGRMETPRHVDEVGWYQYGAQAGAVGNVVLSGHLDDLNGPAIFADLAMLRNGEVVTLQRDDQVVKYEVVSVERYLVEDMPLASIFAATQSTRLQLITCAGTFDPQLGYRERLVVTAVIRSG